MPALKILADDKFGLPAVRHVPGTGTVASSSLLQSIKAKCPERIVSDEWQLNLPYRFGWHLFVNEFFWESHEVWEAVWLRCAPNSREKILMQAIIQLANSRLKLLQGNTKTAQKIQILVKDLTLEAFQRQSQNQNDLLMGIKQRELLELNQHCAL